MYSSPTFGWLVTAPFMMFATDINLPVAPMNEESSCVHKSSLIRYLSAPGAEVLGAAPWLSNSAVSSTAVTTDSTALKPMSTLAVSVYFEINTSSSPFNIVIRTSSTGNPASFVF